MRVILNEALHHHSFGGRRMHPDARCVVVHNVFGHIKRQLGMNKDQVPAELEGVPVMDIPEVHQILTCLCRSIQEDGRMYL